jgi:hypothetical protein
MSSRHRYRPDPLRARRASITGGWIVITDQAGLVSEHVTATEAELAARAYVREGDELVVYDCYHRCHSARVAADRPHDGTFAIPR